MRYAVGFIGFLVLALGIYFLSNIIPASGVFANLESTLVDQCRRVDVAPGTEDVTIDPITNLAYISAANRRDWYNETGHEGTAPTNGIYAFDINDPSTLRRVSPEGFEDFLPHGLSLWRGDDGEQRLFVVNHPTAGGEFIEIFDVAENGALTHLESVSFDAMHSPNDVVGVGPRQFYATNDRGYETGVMASLEAYLALPFASAVYFDGERGRIIQDHLVYANGINKSADGETIYIVEFLKRRIGVYRRDIETGALTHLKNLKVGTGPDNVEVATDGALWVGGHSKVFDFLAHAKDASAIAPSHVVRINPETGESKDVFISINGEINGSSVGAATADTLIVGAVFDGHVMVCPL